MIFSADLKAAASYSGGSIVDFCGQKSSAAASPSCSANDEWMDEIINTNSKWKQTCK